MQSPSAEPGTLSPAVPDPEPQPKPGVATDRRPAAKGDAAHGGPADGDGPGPRGVGEGRAGKEGAGREGAGKVGAGRDGFDKNGPGKATPAKVAPPTTGAAPKIAAPPKIAASAETAASPRTTDPAKTATGKAAPSKDAPTKTAPTEDAPTKTVPSKTDPTEAALGKAAPGGRTPGKAAPGGGTPEEAAPTKTGPTKTVPSKAAPGKAAPGGGTPGKAAPGGRAPEKAAPGRGTPGKTGPTKTAPTEAGPIKTAPSTMAPAKSAPMAPAKTAPVKRAPGTVAPGKGTPAEDAPKKAAPGKAAPGKGGAGKSAPGKGGAGKGAPGEGRAGKSVPAERPGGRGGIDVRRAVRRLPAVAATLRDQLVWLLPAAVTALVAGYRIGTPQLWRDELATWSASTRTVPEIFALGTHLDGVLVPFYLFMHWWVGLFGDSPAALRMPSLIAMAGTAALAGVLGRRLYGRRAGLLAGLLVAAVPAVSRFGQEARGYAPAAFFAVLSTLLLTYALDRPARPVPARGAGGWGWGWWWGWLGYAGSVLLLGWSHQIALLLVVGHAVAVGYAWRRNGRWPVIFWAVAAGAAGLALLPLLRTGMSQRSIQLNWLDTAEPAVLAGLVDTIFMSGIVGGAICAIAAFAVRTRSGLLLWACVLLPVGLLYAVDQLIAPIFVGRYLLFVIPLLCVLAGRGLSALRPPAALVVVLVLAAIGLPVQERLRISHGGFDYRGAAELIAAAALPGDAIVYAPRSDWLFTDIGLRYWSGDRVPRDVLRTADEVQNASFWSTECADPDLCLRGVDRVWGLSGDDALTGRSAGPTDRMTVPTQLALQHFTQVESWRLDGYTLVLLVRPPARP